MILGGGPKLGGGGNPPFPRVLYETLLIAQVQPENTSFKFHY